MRALAHLGPDGGRVRCAGPVVMGHLALAVTREDRFDRQPVQSPAILLAADLRLDNREDLAEALAIPARDLAGLGDSALLLAAWRRWGRDCVDRLLGDFAFALWDGESRRLLLARDPMGQRPLFFHQGGRFFAFATEIKGLLALPEVPRALSEEGMARALLNDPAAPPGSTLFAGIEGVPGGSTVEAGCDGAVTRRSYWSPSPAAHHQGKHESYYREAYRSVLGEAVACRLRRTDRPAALLMSGGFDSAAIAALAAPWRSATAYSPGRLITITSVDPAVPADDPKGARYWVELCRQAMPHIDPCYVTRVGCDIFTGAERRFMIADGLPGAVGYAHDELLKAARTRGARVLLDGFGGDYTLNPRAEAALARLFWTGRIGRFLEEFAAVRRRVPESLWRTFRRDVLVPVLPRAVTAAWRRGRAGLPPWGPLFPAAPDLLRRAKAMGVPGIGSDPIPIRMRASMLSTLRQIQARPTAAGTLPAAHGLVLTEPYHDRRVVELALAIPQDLYIRDGLSRSLVRVALSGYFPPEYRDRPGGNIPLIPDFAGMIRRTMPRLLDDLDRLDEDARARPLLDSARLRRMLSDSQGEGGEDDEDDGASVRLRYAVRAYLHLRYILWFEGGNG